VEVAKRIRAASAALRLHGKGLTEPRMRAGNKRDCDDLCSIAKLVRAGKFRAARLATLRLDTIVRDEMMGTGFFALLNDEGIEW
jgi:hypothetical protein